VFKRLLAANAYMYVHSLRRHGALSSSLWFVSLDMLSLTTLVRRMLKKTDSAVAATHGPGKRQLASD
jgi:hypothetical protein